MFNIGPLELMVLAVVGLIVLGPDRIPGLARDAARMIRTLREMATGTRAQIREELGPEFADVDLRSLHPRTVLRRAVLGDTDFKSLDPRTDFKGGFGIADALKEEPTVSLAKPRPEPLARGDQAPYDKDAT